MAIQKKAKRRSLLFVGDVGVPESTYEAESAQAQRVGPNLRLLLASEPDSCPSGATAGVDLLRLAATGQSVATYGAHPSIRHAASLDPILQAAQDADMDLSVKKIAVGSLQSLALLSTGQLVMLSSDPSEHATAMVIGAVVAEEGGVDVLDVAAGRSHFVLCTDIGTVYTFGWSNTYGQLGDGSTWRVGTEAETGRRPILTDPRRIEGFGITVGAPERQPCIIAVAAGDDHTVLLSASKTAVYVAGRGHGGQLGLANRSIALQPSFKSIPSLFGTEMRAIAAAANHTFVLLECGKLFGFGENTFGALGTGNRKEQFVPTEVQFLDSAEAVNRPATSAKTATDAAKQEQGKTGAALDPRVAASIKAPYGSPLSYMYPRRVSRIPCEMPSDNQHHIHPISEIFVSRSLTIARSAWNPEQLFSCGMHLPVNPLTQAVESNGVLGRPIRGKFETFAFAPMDIGRPSSIASQGWGIALGDHTFVALLDRAKGEVRVQGTVAAPTPGGVGASGSGSRIPAAAAVTSLSADRIRPSSSSGAGRAEDSIPLCVGDRRVLDVLPCKHGLMILVEEC